MIEMCSNYSVLDIFREFSGGPTGGGGGPNELETTKCCARKERNECD
jgi:hypothetical protein